MPHVYAHIYASMYMYILYIQALMYVHAYQR